MSRRRKKEILVRMTEEEYALLSQKVLSSGQTMQSYMLGAALSGKITSSDEISEMQKKNRLLEDMDKQLRGMGTNLNQMAHVANGQGAIPDAEKMVQIAEEVRQIRGEVMDEWRSTRQSINRH